MVGADLNVLQDLVASQAEEHLLGVLTSLQDDTDCGEGHGADGAGIVVILQSFQQEGHEIVLEELVQVGLVLDVVDNVADCPDGLLPHVMSCVATGKHQVAHDCELGEGDGISLGVGGNVGHQPDRLLSDDFCAVCEDILELKHELTVLHKLGAGLIIDCKEVAEEADTVRDVLHLELNEHTVCKRLELRLLGDDLDLLVTAILDDIGDHGHDISL